MTIYKPYTYFIRHNPTGTVYYGVRWRNVKLNKNPEEDLWVIYFTRSNRVRKLIEDYGKESFSIEVRRTFDSVDKAREWESKVLRRMKVLTKPELWLNRTDNKSILNEIHPRGTLGKTWKHPYRPCPHKIGNTNTKGTKWVNNGVNKRMILKDDPIPEGYIEGFGSRPRPDMIGNANSKGYKWINNGSSRRMIPGGEPIPEGYTTGFGPRKPKPKEIK